MTEVDRRAFIVGAMLAGGGAAAALARPVAPPSPISQEQLDAAVPLALGDYHAAPGFDAVLPSRDELSKRIYDRYLARGYVAPGKPAVTLVIAYGSTQDYGLQLHRPETCYPASGWSIGETERLPVQIGPRTVSTSTLSAARPGRVEQILYWTRIGSMFPESEWASRIEILKRGLTRDLPDGVLVRLSTSAQPKAFAIDTLVQFNSLLVEALAGPGRRLLLGRGI
ncbi:EpsI family protein [Sphingomonas gei]|uniref:EpsI family protein n=1 Tax=Sphingomonas gei TaxID=1395960 RepID=A0A4S1XB12_9SPHN|nr:exosortase-associated protein EpsI, V-type [Sphingomonas gei]TGX53514.1 EpsI family protein [Sphingomonas gei]